MREVLEVRGDKGAKLAAKSAELDAFRRTVALISGALSKLDPQAKATVLDGMDLIEEEVYRLEKELKELSASK